MSALMCYGKRICNAQVIAILFLVAICAFSSGKARGVVFDLAGDWSDLNNPNGVWSYNHGGGPMTNHVASYLPGAFANVQPAWANAPNGSNPGHIVSWFQSVNTIFDFGVGDVITHTWDAFNGGISLPHSNLTWTSPGTGNADVTGVVWLARNIGRAVNWSLRINGAAVSGGSLFDGDPFSRANPFDLAAGSGGASVLTDIPVVAGDEIALFLITNGSSGEFTGIDLQIELTPIVAAAPEPSSILVLCWGLAGLAWMRRTAKSQRS